MKRIEALEQFIINGESKRCIEYLEKLRQEAVCPEYGEALTKVLLIETVKKLNTSPGSFYYNEKELERTAFCESSFDIKEAVKDVFKNAKAAADENRKVLFEKLKCCIEKRYRETQFSLSVAARCVGLSQSSATKLFYENEGTTPGEYLGKLRINAGLALLRSGASVMETAVSVGFSSEESFIRAFKKHLGKTPGQWKRNNLCL